jgi:hypothetical protein
MVTVPEDLQQLLEGNDGRIEIDLDGLGVVAKIVIRGLRRRTARVSYPGANNAMDGPELGIRTPESAQGEGGGLRVRGSENIQRWNLNTRGELCLLHA